MKAEGKCKWYLLCDNRAVWMIPHPILEMVPACERCRKLADVPAEKCEPIEES